MVLKLVFELELEYWSIRTLVQLLFACSLLSMNILFLSWDRTLKRKIKREVEVMMGNILDREVLLMIWSMHLLKEGHCVEAVSLLILRITFHLMIELSYNYQINQDMRDSEKRRLELEPMWMGCSIIIERSGGCGTAEWADRGERIEGEERGGEVVREGDILI